MKEGAFSGVSVEEIPGTPILFEPAPDPCTLVIFGVTGDLTSRKLVPALYNLLVDRRLPQPCPIVGVGRERMTQEQLSRQLRAVAGQLSRRKPIDDAAWERLAAPVSFVAGELEDPTTYTAIKRELEAIERGQRTQGNRAFYLAIPPALFPVVVENLHRAGLLYQHLRREARPWCRVGVEKPFGWDLESARELNRLIGTYLDECQVFRVDHYLGKETVQNILVMRFGNSIFEPLWNRRWIDHVQITSAESLGLEGRGRSYDRMGVLVDVVQSHLLQVLAMTAMEPPLSFDADDVRDEKLQVLRAPHPLRPSGVARNVVSAQYRGYQGEPGVAPHSRTATYVAMKLLLDNWRWQGVPFYLRAGKNLAARLTEVAIQFVPIPLCLFRSEQQGCQNIEPNVLILRIQPDEGISLRFVTKIPADHLMVGNMHMSMSYASSFGRPITEAYERLLLDIMRGDATLFARRDLVEQSWRLITPIQRAWEADRESPIPQYDPGSSGPREADELIERDGRNWRSLA
jgi:glucose-6-phosphate 1-dehydrogenase